MAPHPDITNLRKPQNLMPPARINKPETRLRISKTPQPLLETRKANPHTTAPPPFTDPAEKIRISLRQPVSNILQNLTINTSITPRHRNLHITNKPIKITPPRYHKIFAFCQQFVIDLTAPPKMQQQNSLLLPTRINPKLISLHHHKQRQPSPEFISAARTFVRCPVVLASPLE